ncbi:MAG TPA: orotate phosphoribosyltransferase [Acidobacteriota bacterium]|nr:orotate phosphoribosyltransferase [Acidobacteriota bacterium]
MATDWKTVFEDCGAIWIHNGNPARPHALLTSGLHSDGFVNCTKVTQNPSILQSAVSEGLASHLSDIKTDWVIGSAFGAITLAHAVAYHLGARAGFTEKDGELMKLARFEITPNEKVLVVEDTISTGGSTKKTIEGIIASGLPEENILPYIVALVNRSGSKELAGRTIRSLLTPVIHAWPPAECPLCKEGSQPVRPKAHWNELTRKE